jgi:hypothetical protein
MATIIASSTTSCASTLLLLIIQLLLTCSLAAECNKNRQLMVSSWLLAVVTSSRWRVAITSY